MKKIKVLTKEEIETIYKAVTNIREEFLIKLLFENGLRIGECCLYSLKILFLIIIKGAKLN